MKELLSFGFLAITIILTGFDRLFEYTPYSANVRNKFEAITAKNLEKLKTIEQGTLGQEEFKIALISDSHIFYNGLAEMIHLINQDKAVLFVIHGGDVSDGGMLKEFEIFHNIMDDLKKPYFTVIGNHVLTFFFTTIDAGEKPSSVNSLFVLKINQYICHLFIKAFKSKKYDRTRIFLKRINR